MQLAIRPILMAGIAFAGAGVIATAPFTPSLPDVQIPSITTPTLELAALPSYFEWVQAATDALTYQLPTLQQIIESGVDGLLPIVEQFLDHQFPDINHLPTDLPETGTLPSISSLQDAMQLIIAAQGAPDGAGIIPEIVGGLFQVVQDIADFASHAVEPVISYLLKATIATLSRLTATLSAALTDLPQIAFTLVSAAGSVVGTLIDNVRVVVEAATTLDPAGILQAVTDGLANVQHALGEQAGAVFAAVDKFRIDVETALDLPEWLPMPPKSPGSAASSSAALVAASTAAPVQAETDGLGTPNPAAGTKAAAGSGREASASVAPQATLSPETLPSETPPSGTLPSDPTPTNPAPTEDSQQSAAPSTDAESGSGNPDRGPASKAPNNRSTPGGANGKGGSKRESTRRGSTQ
ncbi:MAG: hypothetical protein U0R81_09700 [Mycobacterium sp.]